MVISNGQGFFLASQGTSTLTFVGDVPQGAIAYNIPAGLSTLANKVPVSGPFPGADVGHDFDSLYTWNQAGQAWAAPATYLGGAWDTASTNGPVLDPATAAFYANGGAAMPFTRNFTVQ